MTERKDGEPKKFPEITPEQVLINLKRIDNVYIAPIITRMVNSGEINKIYVTGAPGAGKSTVVKALLRTFPNSEHTSYEKVFHPHLSAIKIPGDGVYSEKQMTYQQREDLIDKLTTEYLKSPTNPNGVLVIESPSGVLEAELALERVFEMYRSPSRRERKKKSLQFPPTIDFVNLHIEAGQSVHDISAIPRRIAREEESDDVFRQKVYQESGIRLGEMDTIEAYRQMATPRQIQDILTAHSRWAKEYYRSHIADLGERGRRAKNEVEIPDTLEGIPLEEHDNIRIRAIAMQTYLNTLLPVNYSFVAINPFLGTLVY